MNNVSVYTSINELSLAAADIIYDLATLSIKNSGRFSIALSGGKTPSMLYSLLAKPPYADKLDWKNIFVFWSDERFVPADDDNNNSHQAKKLMLDHVPIPTENIFTPQVQMQPSESAVQYLNMLKAFFKTELPSFDLILLGMGEDGHTASLFPGTEIHENHPTLVEATNRKDDVIKRLTFTPQLLNNAKRLLVLVSGLNKAKVLADILDKKVRNKYPIQMLQQKKTQWLIDAEAASCLKK